MVGGTWVFALGALVLKTVFWSDVGEGLGLGLYVGMAAIGLGAILVLPRRLPWVALLLMALGALVYVAGAFADHLDVGRLVPGWFGPHEIFHVAVLGALLLHWRFFHDWSIPGRVPPREALIDVSLPFKAPGFFSSRSAGIASFPRRSSAQGGSAMKLLVARSSSRPTRAPE